jgi:hypothetical protein
MLWVKRIVECVNDAMESRRLTPRAVVKLAEELDPENSISPDTVVAVQKGKPGTGLRNVDLVVKALGMQIVADCVPAEDAIWQGDIKQRLAKLAGIREHLGDRSMGWTLEDAEELIHLCDYFIKTGKAKGAVQALIEWRSRGGGATPHQNSGGGNPL